MDDRFDILGELGTGGMATVYLAHDKQRDEKVALKVLHKHLARRDSTRRRLDRELEAAQRVAHPSVLHPLERVEHDGAPALVLPALSGRTLADHVADHGPLDPNALQGLLQDIGGALAAAHSAGVLHRDVTPQNVLWDDDVPRLVDFGLARLAEQGTATTSALGTVGYAAPETYTSGARDPRADAYSLGAVLYFAATGAPPYAAPTAMGSLQLQLDGDHAPLAERRGDLPAAVCHTVDALLEPDLERRPSVPAALRLQPRRRGTAAASRRWQWTQVGSAVSLLAMVGIGWVQDIGAFLLATVIQGHAVPSPDIHEMTQGVSALLLLPLALLPALLGAVAGRNDAERRLAPWMGIGALAVLNLLYAMVAAVVLPEFGMRGSADLFGTMLFHQGFFVVVAALVVGLARPWRALRSEVAAVVEEPPPLAAAALEALGQLDEALQRAPEAMRVDLVGRVKDLREAVEELADELVVVDEGLSGATVDPGEVAALEARRARGLAQGQDVAELDRALAAQGRLLEEADALASRRVRAVAALLEVRAEVLAARRTVVELDEPRTLGAELGALRERAKAARAAAREVAG